MKMITLFFATLMLGSGPLSSATLLVDFSGDDPVKVLGSAQLEGQERGDTIAQPGNSSIFIKSDKDPSGIPALHYHRAAHFRRAEVKAASVYKPEKNYFVGYTFQLQKLHNAIFIFQWKKASSTAAPVQNIPFFITHCQLALCIQYQAPSNNSSEVRFKVLWNNTQALPTGQQHQIALAFDTHSGGNNRLQFWLNGVKKLDKSGLSLWTGDTYPKFGMYRGEKAATGDTSPDSEHVFDSYVYRVQVSNSSINEVKEAGGLQLSSNANLEFL